ncbi:MAG: sulfatase-like hydrolase/transferase [Oscillospiraceae bacterium]|nr:sulfatase-like hydrolase/transferase [Oscillospiraceae bacterium]
MKPNILFLFADQQRWDTLGCYHPSVDFTPNLDQLAAEGVRYEHAFTCQPVCGPARACLQTGLFATQTGCYRNDIPLPGHINTIADRFHAHGYETAYVGKWHLASTGTKPVPANLRGGYRDYWMAADVLEFTSNGYGGHMFDQNNQRVDFSGYRADCQTDFVLDYLDNRQTNKPFFLFVSYLEPHHQNDAGHHQGPPGAKEQFRDYPIPEDLQAFDGGNWAEEYADYLGCCASLDNNVGRIVALLKQRGELENTLIIYTSDHGSHFQTRNSEYKRSCHDSCVRVPLILRGPGFVGGEVVEELASLIDLPVTLLRSAGLESETLQGTALQQSDRPPEVFIQISESHVGRAIRTKRYKYAVKAPLRQGWIHADARVYREAFLYDLENDPHELNNLVNCKAHRQVRAQLRKQLARQMLQAGETAPIFLDGRWRPCRR